MLGVSMSNETIYHYVYRITNLVEKKHYYGKRTSQIHPKLDIGVKYFSSSKDKAFMQDQTDNPSNYRYKVIGVFESAKSAIEIEIFLHKKFDVGINPKFYNRSKQASRGWDTTGMVTVRKNSGETISIPVSEYKANSTDYTHHNRGRKHSAEENIANSIRNSGSKNAMYGSARFGDKNPFHGKTHSIETREKMRLCRLEFLKTNEDPTRGRIWYTNGTINKRLKPCMTVPEGFRKGFSKG
jgi:hypothetical protein